MIDTMYAAMNDEEAPAAEAAVQAGVDETAVDPAVAAQALAEAQAQEAAGG